MANDKYSLAPEVETLAKKIIEKHNGIITAKSKPNEGSSFIVILPL